MLFIGFRAPNRCEFALVFLFVEFLDDSECIPECKKHFGTNILPKIQLFSKFSISRDNVRNSYFKLQNRTSREGHLFFTKSGFWFFFGGIYFWPNLTQIFGVIYFSQNTWFLAQFNAHLHCKFILFLPDQLFFTKNTFFGGNLFLVKSYVLKIFGSIYF